MFKKKYFWLLIILAIFSIPIFNLQLARADESEVYTVSVAPDVLIVLDLSYSMNFSPFGDKLYGRDSTCAPNTIYCTGTDCADGYCTNSKTGCSTICDPNKGASDACEPDPTACSGVGCINGFCAVGKTGCETKCSRLEIAKRALFKMLDDTADNTINTEDSSSLNVRFGLMTFANDSATKQKEISKLGSIDTTPYQTVYCGQDKNGSCTPSSTGTSSTIAGLTMGPYTPLVLALTEANTYLKAHEAADTRANTCRQKFVLLISDGADTKSCSGSGNECQDHMYKRRRESVAAAKQLADAGYRVYVIGFGTNMPTYLINTLNWMAYYGGTDNTSDGNTGNTSDYSIVRGCDPEGTSEQKAACCDLTTNVSACFPSGISSSCADDDVSNTEADGTYCSLATFKAKTNDPGYPTDPLNPLRGYAYMTQDTNQLVQALRRAIYEISGQTYSFTKASIQTIRLEDENFLYEGSFEPKLNPADSFWPGSLKRYGICSQADIEATVPPDGCVKVGDVKTAVDWNAADKFPAADDRKVYTLKPVSGTASVTEFKKANISQADLAVGTEAAQNMIIAYIRSGELHGANIGKKLGDIFHSEPITIGTPNVFAFDKIDTTSLLKPETAYDTYRSTYIRTTANEKRLIMAGTNNAQFHVFKAANAEKDGGKEIWSFIPPNFLPRLKDIAHSTHPTSCVHAFFADGSTAGSDVWWGTNQIDKSASDWHTLIVLSEGRGGSKNLWSSSYSCDTGFSDTYDASYSHHCGYYAFDVTDTTQTEPTFKWKLGGTSGLSATHGTHFADPWNKMSIGRVLYNGTEKWVGFVGGGFNKTECQNKCDTDVSRRAGKGFFVVDTQTGEILWSMTRSGPSGTTDLTSVDMNYSLAGQAAMLDYDDDGFVDTAYIADMGGNVWRFKFCLKSEAENPTSPCTQEDWSGERLFNSFGNVRPIYTKPAVAWDRYGNVWVYFGTGDVTDPTADNAQEVFYAIIDTPRTGTFTRSNLKPISGIGTSVFSISEYSSTSEKYKGWYMGMPGNGIKILNDPIVFFGTAYFTTYAPSNSQNLCEKIGERHLYALDYISGAGQFKDEDENQTTNVRIDDGAPAGPQGSIDNATGNFNIYVDKKPYDPPSGVDTSRNKLLFWRDKRVN